MACRYIHLLRPDYAGFVFDPSRRRYIDPETAAHLRALIPPEIETVGVFVDADISAVLSVAKAGTITRIQLHGHEDESYIKELKRKTDLPVMKAFQIEGASDLDRAEATCADFVLLDHGAGGTGETIDWKLLCGFRRPYFLAGGLRPDNVEHAVRILHPWGVDCSSGIETDGKKDYEKMKKFTEAVRRAEGGFGYEEDQNGKF